MCADPIHFPSIRIVAGSGAITCQCGATLYPEDLTQPIQCESCGVIWAVRATIRPGSRRDTVPPEDDM